MGLFIAEVKQIVRKFISNSNTQRCWTMKTLIVYVSFISSLYVLVLDNA